MKLPTLHTSAQVAACQCSAGMALRPDFTVLEVAGRPLAVAGLVRRVADRRLRAGATSFAAGMWWRPIAPHRVLVTGRTAAVGAPPPDVTVRDVSDRYAVIALAGPRAAELAVRATGASMVALDRGSRAVLVAPTAGADELWRALTAAGAVAVSAATVDLHWAGQKIVECQRSAPPRSVIRR